MKDHDLLEAVGEINEKYIKNAETVKSGNNPKCVYRWIAAAACICIIAGGIVFMTNNGLHKPTPDAGNGVDGTVLPGGEMPEGIDPVVASIAVYPPAERSLEDVANATLNEITEEEAYGFDGLGEHLPNIVIDGYHFRNSSIYETTMKDGTKYYMLRVDFTTGNENIADYNIQVTNYKPKDEDVLTVDSITPNILENGFFTVICGDNYVGMNPGDLSFDEVMMVLNSIK